MLKHDTVDEVRKNGEFADCYLSCDAGEASYMLRRSGFFHADMRKLNNYDYSAFDIYRKLNKGPVRFEGPENSYAECMNIPVEEDLQLRVALKRPQLAFQSKVRFHSKNERLLACFLHDSLAQGCEVAYVNPSTKKAFSLIGGFPSI